jgi:mono/diheme cytochrome c family protein
MKAVPSLVLAAIVLCFAHCTSTNPSNRGLDALAKQVFTINTESDTSILTKDSIRFSFEKGSFNTTAKEVTITIQEALHLSDMLRAGLTTKADGDILQSGGMFNITAEADGEDVRLQKRAGVKMPTYKYRDGMNLYKGELKDGKPNWKEPEALLTKEEVAVAETGEVLYKMNCANCHRIGKDYTGPELAYITERRCYDWLKGYTNSAQYIKDPLSSCIKKVWRNSVMPNFHLSGAELDSLYAYIAAESKKYPREPYFKQDPCLTIMTHDTTGSYDVNVYENKTSKGFGQTKAPMDTVPPTADTTSGTPAPATENPEPPQYPQNNAYYEFTIDRTGWFNIDMLLKTDASLQKGSFQLRVQGAFQSRIAAYLVIPGRKILLDGYTTDNQSFYFDTPDYQLPMPVGEPWVVYLMGEEGKKALWASARGIFSTQQTITLQPREVPDISKELDKLQIDKLEYSITLKYSETRYNIVERLYKANECEGEGDRWRWPDSAKKVMVPQPATAPVGIAMPAATANFMGQK